MLGLFYRNHRLTVLTILLVVIAGLSAYVTLPRMEDPLLTGRIALVHARFPGADAARVEALVTDKLEEELQEVEEIKELRSLSRAGISTLTIELRDDVTDTGPVWSRIRDKIDDAAAHLPPGASEPEFDDTDMKAYALIVALTWEGEGKPSYAILRRLAEELDDALRAVPGNEVQAFLRAGALPAQTLTAFRDGVEAGDFPLPPGYTLAYGGEAAERDEAVGLHLEHVGVLLVLMVGTLGLAMGSFRLAGLVGAVGALSVGLGVGALWVFGYPFGFMAIVGTVGLVGVAINDSIVVLAGLREIPSERRGDPVAVREVVTRATRHVVATSLTTMVGFAPLVLGGGGFWPPLAVAIAGGVGGATFLALCFVPSAYLIFNRGSG